MIYPEVSIKDWIKKYPALSIVKRKCFHCKERLETTIPFIEKDWVGLQSKDCTCGKGKAISISILRPTSELLPSFEHWIKTF